MKVLSLFDGISCGMVALERAGIPVERYVAYEIEHNAIKISKKNYPQIEHCGDVTKADFTQYQGFDLLIGGSPCTNWSCNKNHNAKVKKELFINDGSGWELFMQYKRALDESQPTYFIYENNYRISKNIVDEITNQLGVQPIMIDSALVSAQTRKRLYWTNIPNVQQPADKGIVIRDVFIYDSNLVRTDKRILQSAVRTKNYIKYDLLNKGHYSEPYRLYYLDGKMKTLPRCRTETKCNVLLNDEDLSTYKILSPIEAERYQTLPDNYTEGIPKTRRFEAIGNGWTVDVIAHILSYIKKESEEKQMELKMNEYQLPEQIKFNYEELKSELEEKVSVYSTMVYTDDQIQEAKKDRSNLNKLKKALNDERIRQEKEYMKPFNAFKEQINEIISIIDKPVAVIDKQVKEFEEKKKQEKLDEITVFFNNTEHTEWLHLSQIMDEKWMNASVSMKSVKESIESRLDQIEIDLTTLHDLPEFGFEATEIYKTTLDMNKALNEGHRLSEIAKKKAEREEAMKRIAEEQKAKEEAQPVVPETIQNEEPNTDVIVPVSQDKMWVSFKALLTTEDATALKQFFESRNIEFKAV